MSELYIYEDLDQFDDVFGDLNMTMLHSGEKHRVFVYGTLMSGMRNHSRLETNGVKNISKFAMTVRDDFKMMSRITGSGYIAPIVMITPDSEDHPKSIIRGEVYEVSNEVLIMLDQFEGHPDVYRRMKVPVDYDGLIGSIWMYVYVDTVLDDFGNDGVVHADTMAVSQSKFRIYEWRGL